MAQISTTGILRIKKKKSCMLERAGFTKQKQNELNLEEK